MTQRERRGWFIVVSLFVTLLLIFGSGYNTVAIFLPGLLRGFPDWSRAEVALLPSMLAFSAGVSVIPFGWLLDRVEAKVVMIFGALLSGCAFLLASRLDSLGPMMAAYLLLGVGISAATVLPASMVVANWFEARRGLAMGIAICGTTVGGMVMTPLASHIILTHGWRAAYVVLGIPMIVVVVPLVALMVRTRPPGALRMTVAQSAATLEGFETREALGTRSFWMLVVAHFCFGFAAAGGVVHMVAYLEGLGYAASSAAWAMSGFFACAALGKVTMGSLSDRVSARLALAADFAATGLAFILVFSAAHAALLVLFIILFGVAAAAPLVLLPLLIAEALGRKRYGFLGALAGLSGTLGATVGPVVAGWVFDQQGSYANAFELFIVLDLIGAVATFACRSYASHRARVSAVPVPASASAVVGSGS